MGGDAFSFDFVGCVIGLIAMFRTDLESYLRYYYLYLSDGEGKIKACLDYKHLLECLEEFM